MAVSESWSMTWKLFEQRTSSSMWGMCSNRSASKLCRSLYPKLRVFRFSNDSKSWTVKGPLKTSGTRTFEVNRLCDKSSVTSSVKFWKAPTEIESIWLLAKYKFSTSYFGRIGTLVRLLCSRLIVLNTTSPLVRSSQSSADNQSCSFSEQSSKLVSI